jgi:microcystin degradation protein MlrC
LAPGVYPTTEEPVAAFVARLTDAQRRPGVLMVAANHGFEGSDQPDTSASVVVTTDGDVELARSIAWEVSTDFCSTITSIPWRGPDVDAAVEAATTSVDRPVVIADGSDNAGGGAASDSTYLLAELLRRGVDEVAVALVWDRQAVTNCHVAGVGARLPLRIGGKSGPLSGDPVDVVAEVTSVRTDACQALFGVGEPSFPLGRSASIRVDGIDVVLNTSRQQVFSRHVFTEHGIDPAQRHILVVKSLQHFVHDFGPIAARVIRCDAPGTMTRDLSTFPFQRVRRPMRRLDDVDHLDLEEFAVAPP